MNTIKIFLVCPICGKSDWIEREDIEGEFECAACGELVFTEDMDARTSDDK